MQVDEIVHPLTKVRDKMKFDLNTSGPFTRDGDMRQLLLIDLDGESPNRAQVASRLQRERLTGEASNTDGVIVCSRGNNEPREVGIPNPFAFAKVTIGGCTRFGCHWLINNCDITNLPGPSVAFA